jgi:urate oxidase
MPQLASQKYGKDRVRVLRVKRQAGGIHSVHEVEASVALEGDFAGAYLSDNNSHVVPTDTMKNTVHILAQKHLGDVIEDFALALARHFLGKYPQVARATVRLTSRPWDRLHNEEGDPYPHTFTGRATSAPACRVQATREKEIVQGGVKDVVILNSTASAFVGYPKCDYTTLPETKDRILATKMEATWTFTPGATAFGKANDIILDALLSTFAKEFSPSVQNTLFLMGSAALAACSDIADIHLAMPNKHYLPISFQPFGLENNNEIFLPTDEPHGQIEALVTR